MARAYKVIDADGHILEPIDLWDRYMDPAYREHAPRLIIGDNGRERLLVEGKILGNPKGLGRLGAVGAYPGGVAAGGVAARIQARSGRGGGSENGRSVNWAFVAPMLYAQDYRTANADQ